jgi:hypothetical protein
MSLKDYHLRKGMQMKQFTDDVVSTPTTIISAKSQREISKYRDGCPPGTEDETILKILERAKGDTQKIQTAINELWELNPNKTPDEWAFVGKKGKKKEAPKSSYSPEESSDAATVSREGRGGATRGRGGFASRGGRGGGRGRGGRGAQPPSRGATKGDIEESKSAEKDEASAKPVGDKTESQSREKPVRKEGKNGPPSYKGPKPTPSNIAPPAPSPILTGAWAKKPNLSGMLDKPKPKPAEPIAAKPKTQDQPATAVPATLSSPKEKAEKASEPDKKEAEAKPKPAAEKPKSPVATPAAVKSPKPDKAPEPKAAIPSAWGSLDVSTASIGEWPSKSKEMSTSTTPNGWARGSPILTPVSTKEPAAAVPTVVPGSPKDIQVSRSESASSPKQYLKMGKWDSSESLSLQFGSFSLNGKESSEAASPSGWNTTSSSSKPAAKNEGQSAWGTQSVSPKKTETKEPESRKAPASGTSAPPGLTADSGRISPKSTQSPRGFSPAAPSPANLPKPDETKRSTPTRSQGHFPTQAAPQQQPSSKLNLGSTGGYGAGFYGQYGINNSIGNTGNISQGTSNTPKSQGRQNAATQSPSHGPQQGQAQLQQLQMSQQQQQKPQQQQVQPQQSQQPQGQQQPLPQPQPGPQGYHPHYAPPPPPGMAMPYNPYNYASYYQGYGYYQNPQYPQYNPRSQYPPRGNMPYGVEGPIPGFSNPPK